MDVVLYKSNKHKKINGSLFYSFEYFAFLKQFVPNLKFYILNASGNDLEQFKDIFKDKYVFDMSYLKDILSLSLIEFAQTPIDNLLMLCTDSYKAIKDLAWNVKHIRTYSHNSHNFLNTNSNHTFYGWYDYQNYNKQTRLKFYKDIHRTSNTVKDKIFVSALNGDMNQIVHDLKLDTDMVYIKQSNVHTINLFDKIGKIVYYHTGSIDTNNRIVVESFIHDIPLELHLNGHTSDSVAERTATIKDSGLGQFVLSTDDIMIKDFLNECDCVLQ